MKEQDLVNQCMEYLTLRGFPALRMNQGGLRAKGSFVWFCKQWDPVQQKLVGMKGVSDILAWMPPAGRVLACEVKLSGNEPTAEQSAFLEAIKQAGGLAVIAYSLDDLEEALEGLEQ